MNHALKPQPALVPVDDDKQDAKQWATSYASPIRRDALDGGKARMETARVPIVIIVDDDDAVRETLVELLGLAGYQVIAARASGEALEALSREPRVDALVTDLTMPGDDGIALIRRARHLHATLPAVLLTGYAEQATAVSTIAGGRVHVLRKPVHFERLAEQLELLIDANRGA